MDLIRDNPELRPFILSDVALTSTRIGAGAYGSVEEVTIPVLGAAKRIHDIFQDRSEIPEAEMRRASTQFAKECQLMSTLRHPHLVQFLGVCFFPGSRLPALVMERLLTSLHDLLAPETHPPPDAPSPLSFFSIGLKCSVLEDTASGLDYLHHQTPPIIHRDLSARNILLNSRLLAKIADLGVARIVPCLQDAATMTKAPGASVYMPPEAIAPSSSNTEKSKYDASIDIFSFGVVTIFTIGETFPCDPLAPTYLDEVSGMLIARTELQRRNEYMTNVNTQLHACGQHHGNHPLIRLIQQCLNNSALKRPNIVEVVGLLEEARTSIRDEESETNKVELVRAIQDQLGNQNLMHLIDNLVADNAELHRSSTQQLMRKDSESTFCRDQQQIEEMRQLQQQVQYLRQQETQKDDLLQAKDRELGQVQQQLRQLREQESEKDKLVQTKDSELTEAQQQLRQLRQDLLMQAKDRKLVQEQQQVTQQFASYTCGVSGPGLQSAIVNHPTHITIELTDSGNRPCSAQQKVTAELELISEATHTSATRTPPAPFIPILASSPSQYEATYTAVSRGQYKLHVSLNDKEIDGSPFTTTVYPNPTQLGHPVRMVTGLNGPYDMAFNSHREMLVTTGLNHQVCIFDIGGHRIGTFGSRGSSPEQMIYPAGIAIDEKDNIYVTSKHKLQKFSSSIDLIKCVGKKGNKMWQFDDPRGITLHGNEVYVCDCNNHRIQVFDLNLNFVRSIGSHGEGRANFNEPRDVRFDKAGCMYVADFGNKRVHVIDDSGHFLRVFGNEKLHAPSSLHVVDKYVYVSDYIRNYIVVYETSGQFITSFGGFGDKEGVFYGPYSITSCADGFIYVCDSRNCRIQIF